MFDTINFPEVFFGTMFDIWRAIFKSIISQPEILLLLIFLVICGVIKGELSK
ncbi:hypothetical protein MKY04_18055 [Lysinibacillus telephonicus]|uniref:hypothetical protein n=1 Tax=Lysinibacillus telephonicus TaxID=1714840 RepID=UPI0031FC15C8